MSKRKQIKTDPGNVRKDGINKKPKSTISPKQIARMLESAKPKERLAAVEKLEGNDGALKYVAMNSGYGDSKTVARKKLDAIDNGDSDFVRGLTDVLIRTQT